MHEILSLIYFWLKAGHVIFVIFWMAGLFMLPRYYIYHQEAAPDSPERERWIDREAKLRKIDDVRAAIGHLAAGVVINIAEPEMAALLRVGRERRGAQPHVVVEARGHRHFRLRTDGTVVVDGLVDADGV